MQIGTSALPGNQQQVVFTRELSFCFWSEGEREREEEKERGRGREREREKERERETGMRVECTNPPLEEQFI